MAGVTGGDDRWAWWNEIRMEDSVALSVTFVDEKDSLCRFRIQVPEDWTQEQEKEICLHLSNTVAVRGFRRGKVPAPVIKKLFRQALDMSLIEAVLKQANGDEAIKEAGYLAVSEPDLDLGDYVREKDKGVSLEFSVWAVARKHVPDTTPWTLSKYVFPVTDADVERRIADIQERLGWYEESNEGARTGDVLQVHLQRLDRGVPIVGDHTSEPVTFRLGDNSMGPETDRQLLGAQKGEERRVTSVPSPKPDSETGQSETPTQTQVQVMRVLARCKPQLDEEFFKAVSEGEADTVGAFAEWVRRFMELEAQHRQQALLRKQVQDLLSKESSLEAPEALVDDNTKSIKEELSPQTLQRLSTEDLAMLRGLAARNVKVFLLLDAIATDWNISATKEEIDEAMEAEKTEKADGETHKASSRSEVNKTIIHRKVFDRVLSHVKLDEVAMTSFYSDPEDQTSQG